VSARKIGLLILLLAFGAAVETAWSLRGHVSIGSEGCRVIEGRFYGPSFTFEQSAERALKPAAGQVAEVEVRNAFGGVRLVAGGPDAIKVTLRKVVFRPTEEKARAFADRIVLRLEGEGAQVRVTTNRGDLERGEAVGFETHLELQVPPEATVTVRNEHGRVEVTGIARADVASSFDDVALERIAGRAAIDARHGAVHVSDVGTELKVLGRHGDVEVTGVKGPSTLDVEHGNVRMRQTGGLDVRLQYGDLSADNVEGDLVVRARHAAVEASDVTGRVEAETSYNSIRLARVGGEVRAKTEHGSVTAEDVKGAVTAETSYEGVHLDRIAGSAELSVHHGGVEAKGLDKGARVRASGDEVAIEDFQGPVDVTVERGGVRLVPREPITEAITASSTQGDVRLEVPEGSRINLDAESRRGEVRTDVKGLSLETAARGEGGPAHRASGKLGGGGSLVRLRADGDISVESRPSTARVTPQTAASARPPAEKP
jgi:DUF4097 and DUF4098 domain-containing protein YvlB